MNKIRITEELLMNSNNFSIKEKLEFYITILKEPDNVLFYDEEFIRLDNVVDYIKNEKFNILGWALFDIPVFYSHCFYNEYTKEAFDLAVCDIGEVIPRYLDSSYNEQDAKTIEEAIKKYDVHIYENFNN
ncbi:hypothetical protein [Tissierella sp.]|uniref:hypothetical protein n=1 Tax=Tissierella sp. TaxID=41274 RepID=UPI003062D01A